MKGVFASEQKDLPGGSFQILPDVSEDKEKKAESEKLMHPIDVSHIKIPTNIQDERFDQLIYREPYFTQHGNTFEFERITEWLEKNDTDPADNEVLENRTLVQNKGFLSRVNQFLEKNPQVLDSAELYLPRRWVSELELACQAGDLEKIKRLYDLDKRLFSWTFDFTEEKYAQYQGKNILHITCARGKPEAILKLLEYIEKRAEGLALLMLLQKDKHGKLPIQYAMEAGDNLLLIRMLAAKMGKHLQVVEPIVTPSTNSQENRYQTALHIAAMNNDANLIKFLVEHKADVHIKNSDGNTALHLALGLGSKESIEILIQLGASEVIENDNGLTPEKLGTTHSQNEAVQILSQALEQRTKTQQGHLKDLGPLSQMLFNMKFSLEQLAIKSQRQDDEIGNLRETISSLYCEIGYLRLTGHALNREFIYSSRQKQSSSGLIGLFGLPLMLSQEVKQDQTCWTPNKFGDRPITRNQARKMILEKLPPQAQKAVFFVEEKGCSKDYTFTSLEYKENKLACWAMLSNGNIITSYYHYDKDGYKSYNRFFIKIWDPNGGVIKEIKTEYQINALYPLSNGSNSRDYC